MSNYLPGKLIRFYICANCAATKKDVAENPTLCETKGTQVRPWDCSQCGRHVHSLNEKCFNIAANRLNVNDFDRSPESLYEIWFVNKNYGYFETQFPNIVEIET
jgi:hypothetical protein